MAQNTHQLLINVPLALEKVEEILNHALASGAHKPFDWKYLSIEQQLEHLDVHVNLFLTDNLDEDHLANIACRALFALQLREEQSK